MHLHDVSIILAACRARLKKRRLFLTLWDRAGLGPSHCRSPCRRPPQWSSLLPGPPAESCWTGSCTASGSARAVLLSPSSCTTCRSLETELQVWNDSRNDITTKHKSGRGGKRCFSSHIMRAQRSWAVFLWEELSYWEAELRKVFKSWLWWQSPLLYNVNAKPKPYLLISLINECSH